MLIFRGAVTQHPRGSTSAPAMSPHYWIPPTSVSCTGVTEVQSLLAPLSAAALLHHGAPQLVGQRDDDVFPAERQSDDDAAAVAASSEPLDASFPTEPPVKRSWSRGVAFFVAVLLAFGGSLAVMFVVSQLLQPRELAGDEQVVTAVARQPLVQEPSSGNAYGEDEAAAVHEDVAALPLGANRSVTVGDVDRLPKATTRSVLRGRHRASRKPRVTDAVPSSAVDSSVGTETTAWLD